jgi:hypothetical protein
MENIVVKPQVCSKIKRKRNQIKASLVLTETGRHSLILLAKFLHSPSGPKICMWPSSVDVHNRHRISNSLSLILDIVNYPLIKINIRENKLIRFWIMQIQQTFSVKMGVTESECTLQRKQAQVMTPSWSLPSWTSISWEYTPGKISILCYLQGKCG